MNHKPLKSLNSIFGRALKRRRGESGDAYSYRLAAMYRAGQQRDREAYDLAEAARRERANAPRSPHEPPAPVLPALDQVSGWSGADPSKRPHHDGVALFGGWRLDDMEQGGE